MNSDSPGKFKWKFDNSGMFTFYYWSILSLRNIVVFGKVSVVEFSYRIDFDYDASAFGRAAPFIK